MAATSTGDRIRRAREAAGWTQDQLARKAGVSRGLISQWETGMVQAISAANLTAAAHALSVSVDWLLSGAADSAAAPINEDPGAYSATQDADHGLRQLLAAWHMLTARQRADLLRQAATWADENRALIDELTSRR